MYTYIHGIWPGRLQCSALFVFFWGWHKYHNIAGNSKQKWMWFRVGFVFLSVNCLRCHVGFFFFFYLQHSYFLNAAAEVTNIGINMLIFPANFILL